jgi:arylsulfatase A-like enzyme
MPGEVQLPHLPYLKNDKVVAYIPDGENQALICDAVTDAAVDFIKRHKNEPFFAYIPHAAIHGPVFVKDKFVDYSSEKGFSPDVYKEVVSAHIEEVDASVGRVLNTLKELNIDKNTFVFFTSDNGGGKKWSSMGPLRGGKGAEPYEGRMREPAIAWWPGKIPSGKVTNEIVASIDILPTLASIAGAKLPADRQIDGNDVTDILFGKANAKSPHDVLYHHTDAIRKGDWKLLKYYNKKKKKDCTELYNLKTDIGERNDLSKQYPDKVKELQIL